MYATTTTGHIEHTSGSQDTKVLQLLIVWQTVAGAIIQDSSTTIEQWVGLSYADAISVAQSYETSTLNGTTRSYLGNAVLTSSGGASIRCVSCWGTKVSSTWGRMSGTNCYQVTKTTTVYSVRDSGTGSLTLE